MIYTSAPNHAGIDERAALALLAELRVNEQADEFNAVEHYLLQRCTWIPSQLVSREAKALAQQRGVALRPWKGQFKRDLAHILPSIGYLN